MALKSRPEKDENVRSVERAIELLEALNRRPLSTVGELQSDIGLPKSSIVRLLRTLEEKGLVTQTRNYGAYRLLGPVKSLSNGFSRAPLIVEVAEEIMIDFTRREGWPLALGLFDADAMVVSASTIPYTPFACVHSSLNIRLSLIKHAVGRAFLAHCSPTEQNILLEIVRQKLDPRDSAALDFESISDSLQAVRECGYALRDKLMHVMSSTIAVPVYDDGRLVASLGLTWLAAAMPMERAVAHYAPLVRGLADQISTEVTRRSTAARTVSHLDLSGDERQVVRAPRMDAYSPS